MRKLFWLTAGVALGVAGYRYYEKNGGRLPIVDDLLGGRTDEVVRQATKTARSMQRGAKRAVSESVGNVARETMTTVAEEIAEAEHAKQREEQRQG